MDTLNIKALNVSTKIGVYAWEQRILQQLLIDISIDTDFSDCQEDLGKTVDYEALCKNVTLYVESKSFQLIETVANEVAELIKNNSMFLKLQWESANLMQSKMQEPFRSLYGAEISWAPSCVAWVSRSRNPGFR